MKKKYLLMAVAAILLGTTAVGGTMAALDTETSESAVAGISVKDVQVTTVGTTDGELVFQEKYIPGSECVYPVHVENNNVDGYDIYVKVELYKSWSADELDAAMGTIYRNEENDGWLVQYEDDEQIVMYYTHPLTASTENNGHKTTNFMDGIHFSTAMNNAYANQSMEIEYVVTAVQANNSEDAIAAEWGMFPVFDTDGTLVSVHETRAAAEEARAALVD